MSSIESVVTAGFDALPAHVAILDEDGVIVYTNDSWDAFGDAQGLTDGSGSAGANYLEVCDDCRDEDAVATARGIRDVIAARRTSFSHEYPCHTPEAERWFAMEATAFPRGDDRYALVMHVDVTDRRALESRSSEQADRLESFATVLSHDLRNPLAVALAHAQTIEAGGAGAAVEGGARDGSHADLVSALERMETILDDALVLVTTDDVDRVEAIHLSAVAEEAWSYVPSDRARLAVAGSIAFRADRSRLSHLFENLFRNAIEHGTADDGAESSATPTDGGCPLTVEVGPLVTTDEGSVADDGSGRVDGFYVEDDGRGIPPDVRDRVFESGFTTAAEGSGFGLAIVTRVARAHDWTVSVTTGRSGGARFEFRNVATLPGETGHVAGA